MSLKQIHHSEIAPKVVIVGAGFAGTEAAKTLAKSGVKVLLIDRHNYHTFIPMLYQVATAVLNPQQVVYPLRRLFRNYPNVRFIQTTVKEIDFTHQLIYTERAVIDYDYLILATGSQSQYLGVSGAAEYALPMRTLPEAITIRNHILSCCEQAVQTTNEDELQQLLTFVIVGGGPTGVELAGALRELVNGPLPGDYPELDLAQARVILLQAGKQILKSYPPRLGDYTTKWLRRHGVKVHLQSRVNKVTPDSIYLEDGEVILTKTVIWTAGVVAATPQTQEPLATGTSNKIQVTPTLQVADQPGVYAVGDLAQVEHLAESLNGVAQEAIQQGKAAAENILRQYQGKVGLPFEYKDKGRLAIIGRHAGVGQIGKSAFTGWLAWFLWLAVHLRYLPGIRNRLGVLFNWLKCYFLGEVTMRLILKPAVASKGIKKGVKKEKL